MLRFMHKIFLSRKSVGINSFLIHCSDFSVLIVFISKRICFLSNFPVFGTGAFLFLIFDIRLCNYFNVLVLVSISWQIILAADIAPGWVPGYKLGLRHGELAFSFWADGREGGRMCQQLW